MMSRTMIRDRMRNEDPKVSGHTPHADESEQLTFIKHSLVICLYQITTPATTMKKFKKITLMDST